MRNLYQLTFNFTIPEPACRPHMREPVSWRVRHLSRRYRLPESQARLYAGLLGLPMEARHDR